MTRFKPLLFSLVGSAALLTAAPLWADPTTTATPSTGQTTVPATKAPAATDSGTPAKTDSVKYDDAMKRRMDNRKAFMDARMAALRAGLQLTSAQEPLWSPVEDALRGLGKAHHHAMHMRRDETSDPSARLKQRSERLIAMGQAIGKLADASGPFVKSLSPEQKERLPILLHRIGPRGILRQAFASADGAHWGGGGWRHHRRFAERGGDERRDFGGRGLGGHDMDRPDFRDGDRGGWHHRDHGRDREGRAGDGGDRGGDTGFDRDGGSFHHHHERDGDDERG